MGPVATQGNVQGRERTRDVCFAIVGPESEGAAFVGEILLAAAAARGFACLLGKTPGASGSVSCRVRFGRDEVLSPGDRIDVVALTSWAAWPLVERDRDLAPDAVFVEDPDDPAPGPRPHRALPEATIYAVPLTKLAREGVSDVAARPLILLGALGELFGFSRDALHRALARRGIGSSLSLESGMKAVELGGAYVREKLSKRDAIHLTLEPREPRLVLSGNEALAYGALVAGCRFFAAAPSSGPSGAITSWLAEHLPPVGGYVAEAEDPAAALGMVLGASFAGVRAMTATSGPGVSLMSALVGYASAAEIPAVIVNVQHVGPAAGMPSGTEQADLAQALGGTHGDAPRVVIAPADVEDCFDSALLAFHVAERYQLPVHVLTDRLLGEQREAIPRERIAAVSPLESERLAPQGSLGRYALTVSGVSPMPIPGSRVLRATGLAHDEHGRATTSFETHALQLQKRARKLRSIQDELSFARVYGPEKAVLGIIAWGSSKGAVKEAVRNLNAKGIPVKAIVPQVQEPLPVVPLRQFVRGLERALVVELSLSGQWLRHLRASLDLPCELVAVNRPGGLPWSAREIEVRAMEVLGR